MENNAYKEKVLKINGKEIVIPEVLTFSQILSCENKGLSVQDVSEKPFNSACIIYCVLVGKTIKEGTRELSEAIDKGELNPVEILEAILPAFSNFFARRSN